MEYTTLGVGGPDVSRICFGCWAMGARGWGEVDDRDTVAAVRRAFDLGVTFYDTADLYGPGHSEEMLGKALEGIRDQVLVATKGGRRLSPEGVWSTDGRPEWLHQAIDASLQRLRMDYVDLYQLHWPDPNVPVEESVGALKQIQEAGKARYVGVSNFSVSLLERARSACEIVSNQIPFNMLYREYLPEVLPYCEQNGIGIMGYGTLAQGLLTGKFGPDTVFPDDEVRAKSPLFAPGALERNLQLVEALRPIADRHGKSLAQVAVNWVLSHSAATTAICGAKRPSQIEDSSGGAGWSLTDDDLATIESLLPPSYDSPRPMS